MLGFKKHWQIFLPVFVLPVWLKTQSLLWLTSFWHTSSWYVQKFFPKVHCDPYKSRWDILVHLEILVDIFLQVFHHFLNPVDSRLCISLKLCLTFQYCSIRACLSLNVAPKPPKISLICQVKNNQILRKFYLTRLHL